MRAANKAGVGPPGSSQSKPARARLFRNGASQALRLPKEFRFAGTEVLIHREGNRVILEPADEVACDANGWPIGIRQVLAELREGLDVDEYLVPPDPVPPPLAAVDDA